MTLKHGGDHGQHGGHSCTDRLVEKVKMLEIKLKGSEERCQLLLNSKNYWANQCRELMIVLGLSAREIELINGMIVVQLRHAQQCDNLRNRPMAIKQKANDMERVALLKKVLFLDR